MKYVLPLTFLFCSSVLFANDKVDFAKDVQPILKENCYKCHYDKKKKGDFTFLTRETILKGGKEGNDVIPGKSSDSLMIKLILSKDDSEYMPPKGPRLTEAEVNILKKWIDQGVKMEETSGKESPKKEEPKK